MNPPLFERLSVSILRDEERAENSGHIRKFRLQFWELVVMLVWWGAFQTENSEMRTVV